MSIVFISGVNKNANSQELEKLIKDVFLKASNNLSWLKPGESVLIKPAVNSFDPYPATTHPLALKVVVEVLREKGARVVVGDQSGIEHVVQDENGVLRGSSKKCFESTGMGAGLNLDFKGFEEEDWNFGFYKFASTQAKSWPNGFYLTNRIKQVDHMINLPRLSTHAQAGVTLGFKNMVGLLRTDSRLDFHANGPLKSFAKTGVRGSTLVSRDDKMNKFFEKIVEISLAVQNKLRLTLFVGTEAQVTIGPDQYGLKFMGKRMVKAHRVIPETGFVFASQDQVVVEVMGIALLTIWHRKIPLIAKFWQMLLAVLNHQAKVLGTYNPWENPFIKHGLACGLGSPEVELQYDNVSAETQGELNDLVFKH